MREKWEEGCSAGRDRWAVAKAESAREQESGGVLKAPPLRRHGSSMKSWGRSKQKRSERSRCSPLLLSPHRDRKTPPGLASGEDRQPGAVRGSSPFAVVELTQAGGVFCQLSPFTKLVKLLNWASGTGLELPSPRAGENSVPNEAEYSASYKWLNPLALDGALRHQGDLNPKASELTSCRSASSPLCTSQTTLSPIPLHRFCFSSGNAWNAPAVR